MPTVLEKDKAILKTNKKTPQDKKEEKQDIPKYMSKLELSDTQKTRLTKEIIAEYEQIKNERNANNLEEKWDGLDAQYEGEIEEDEDRQFNLHKHTTKVKVDAVSGAIVEAFLESDPIYSISPRPEFVKTGASKVAEKQQDFIDYKMDTVIPIKEAMSKVAHSAVLKGTGIIKWTHKVMREKRKREEVYEGAEGLKDFIRNYPSKDKVKGSYDAYIERLSKGGKVNIISEYTETTYNDPFPEYIDLKNFFCRVGTKGYEGLKTEQLLIEKREYTWWQLKKKEKEPNGFNDIDKLMYKLDKAGKETKVKNHESEKYEVIECVFYFNMKAGAEGEEKPKEEYTKMVCWIAVERNLVIGSILYPYYAVDCYYVPHYIKNKVDGFYQPGIGEDLTDSNKAEDALLNFTLEGAWASNIVTPITDDPKIASQFLEKRWAHGVPITASKDKIDFLNRLKQPFDSSGLIGLMQYLVQNDDDVSGVSSLMSGRESPVDPSAPASKTLALMQRSGINVKRYLQMILVSFNITADVVLQIYAQMSEEGRKYKIRPSRVVGENPFETITRGEMIARTIIHSQAMAFDFDKLNQKRELVSFLTLMRQEPLLARNPEALNILFRSVTKAWSPLLKSLVDELWPSPEQFKNEQMQTAVQAVDIYVKAKSQEAAATGQAPELDPMELIAMMNDIQAEVATPPSEEVQKERAKQANAAS